MQHWTSNVIILLCVHKIRKQKIISTIKERERFKASNYKDINNK